MNGLLGADIGNGGCLGIELDGCRIYLDSLGSSSGRQGDVRGDPLRDFKPYVLQYAREARSLNFYVVVAGIERRRNKESLIVGRGSGCQSAGGVTQCHLRFDDDGA